MIEWRDDELAETYLKRKHTPPSPTTIAAWRMEQGPFIAKDGYTLIIPSEWYNPDAAQFWRDHGFTFERDTKSWIRDTRRSFNRKTFSASAWLAAATKKFFEFWPRPEKEESQ